MEWGRHRRFRDASVGRDQEKGWNHGYKANSTKCLEKHD